MSTERVVIVTGTSSGIGAAIIRAIAAPGVALLAHARGGKAGEKRDLLEAVAREAREAGAACETMLGDLDASGHGAEIVAHAVERFGRVDQIVSNAGYADRRPFGEADRAALDTAHRVMTGAFFDLVTAALPHLRASACGRVVALSSFVAHVAPRGRTFPPSAAAKAALEALVRNLAVELAPKGVTVNAVAPGYTRKDVGGHTPLATPVWEEAARITPTGRLAEPAEVAALVAFLLRPQARQITGQVIHIDGGLGLV